MLKVKELELLQEYKILVANKNEGIALIESDAVAFAKSHGYSEEKTKRFVDFVLSEESNGGLSEMEAHKLEVLSEFIEEVEDDTPEILSTDEPQETEQEEVAEIPEGSPDVNGGSVNII